MYIMNKPYKEQIIERYKITNDLMWEIYEKEKKSGKQDMELNNILEELKEKEKEFIVCVNAYGKTPLEDNLWLKPLIVRYMPNVFEILASEFLKSRTDLSNGVNNMYYDNLFNQLTFIALPDILVKNKIYNIPDDPEFQDRLVLDELKNYYINYMTSTFQDENIVCSNSTLDYLTRNNSAKIKRLECDVAKDLYEQRYGSR